MNDYAVDRNKQVTIDNKVRHGAKYECYKVFDDKMNAWCLLNCISVILIFNYIISYLGSFWINEVKLKTRIFLFDKAEGTDSRLSEYGIALVVVECISAEPTDVLQVDFLKKKLL